MKKVVTFVGPALTSSGYGTHSRAVLRYLLEKRDAGKIDLFVKALPWGMTPWHLNREACDGLIGKIFDCTSKGPDVSDVTVQLQLPNEWDTKIGRKNIGITAAVETDICNPSWIASCNAMDRVIVPSQHVKKTIEMSGQLNKQIDVVFEPYSDRARDDISSKIDLDLTTDFNFLVFGQLSSTNIDVDRKNTFNTVKWLCEAFADDQNVGVVVKTNLGRNSRIDRSNCKQIFSEALFTFRKTKFPRFYLLHGELSETEISQLYRHEKIKCLVSLSRGEGFCLPMLDAAAHGMPVIATAWSGHRDFMDMGKYIGVDYDLREITKARVDKQIFVNGAKWAEPRENDFKTKIAKFRNHSDVPREWARDLREKILKKLSFEEMCSAYDAVLGDIL